MTSQFLLHSTAQFVPSAEADPRPDGTGLFAPSGAETQHFAVIDAARVFGFAERMKGYDLAAVCLYDLSNDPALGEVAPWLVPLVPGHPLAIDLVADTAEAPNHWELLRAEAAIFIETDQSLEQMRAHLRRYTQLPDEAGVRYFFRFYDPFTLPALMQSLSPPELAGFMQNCAAISCVTPRYDGAWLAHRFAVDPSLRAMAPAPVVIDKYKRDRLQHVAFMRKAWEISHSVDHTNEIAAQFEQVAIPLMFCAYSDPERLLELFALHRQLPPEGKASLIHWAQSGKYSPRHLGLAIARQYGLTYPDGATQ